MLLADPGSYAPGTLDLASDPVLRGYWLDLFRRHIRQTVALVARDYPDVPEMSARMRKAAARFVAHVDAVAADPVARFDTLSLCDARERCLRAAGVADPYRRTKDRESEAALRLLPALLAELDGLPEPLRLDALVRGIFAGNVFDLGSHATASLFAKGGAAFHDVRERLQPRPWRVDDLDAFRVRLQQGVSSALLFVDNAGSDVVLGMLPFARELLRQGAHVLLSANETPALNDVTHEELEAVLARAASLDALLAGALADGRLSRVSSGGGLPLLDLRQLSAPLQDAIDRRPPDLVVLEGMGRAIESNWRTRLRIDTLKIAMLKDESVARLLGGTLYDLVCRYEPAAERPGD